MIKKIWILIVLMCVFPASTIKAKIQNEIIEYDETGIPDNQLTNLKGMNKLTKLSCLGLSGNRLKNVKEIKNLKNLKKLSLNEN